MINFKQERKIFYLSDWAVKVESYTDVEGNTQDPATAEFRFIFFTSAVKHQLGCGIRKFSELQQFVDNGRAWEVSHIDGERVHCELSEGELRFNFEPLNLEGGISVRGEELYYLQIDSTENDGFTDGSFDSRVMYKSAITIVADEKNSDPAADVEVAIVTNAVKVDLTNYVKTDDERLSDSRRASDVSAWAKAEEKPSYTANEVGALPNTTVLFDGDYNSLNNKPTIPTELPNPNAIVINGTSYDGSSSIEISTGTADAGYINLAPFLVESSGVLTDAEYQVFRNYTLTTDSVLLRGYYGNNSIPISIGVTNNGLIITFNAMLASDGLININFNQINIIDGDGGYTWSRTNIAQDIPDVTSKVIADIDVITDVNGTYITTSETEGVFPTDIDTDAKKKGVLTRVSNSVATDTEGFDTWTSTEPTMSNYVYYRRYSGNGVPTSWFRFLDKDTPDVMHASSTHLTSVNTHLKSGTYPIDNDLVIEGVSSGYGTMVVTMENYSNNTGVRTLTMIDGDDAGKTFVSTVITGTYGAFSSPFAAEDYVDTKIGTIDTILDNINGVVI